MSALPPWLAKRPPARSEDDEEALLLQLGLADFQAPQGMDFEARYAPLAQWVDTSAAHGLFQFIRHHENAPNIESEVTDFGGHRYRGINLASQDYLGLAQHPAVVEAAAAACRQHGTHSAGSEPMGGGLASAKRLERKLAVFLEHPRLVLFPTGWAAGYGAIKGLVRPYDHVVLDSFAHDCLQHGARASTPHVTFFAHNDTGSLRRRLTKVRSAHPDAAILVVTESLFSMDSDCPDFAAILRACRESCAYLMVDVAHDLGVLGPGGRGILAQQDVLPAVDFIVGSFSKAFASIGGFFAASGKGGEYAVRAFSGSYTFSNFLTPAQVAAVEAAFDIIASDEGDRLRSETLERSECLRAALAHEGIKSTGQPSAMVIVPIGAEATARAIYRRCMQAGVILNCIEYPACRRGEARLRFQVSPRHRPEQLAGVAAIVARAVREAPPSARDKQHDGGDRG